MDNKDLIKVLEGNFGLRVQERSLDTDSEYLKHIQKLLAEKIKFLIRTDLDKLLQILYRIDLNQNITDQAFELGEINAISKELAKNIIIRQLKKIEYSRRFYKKE